MRAVPRGTPDPDGDRRFAERPFPLLEPVEWTGERHRWGYGTREPTGITTSLGLVFGPWDRFTTEPRLAVTVGSEFPSGKPDRGEARLDCLRRELCKELGVGVRSTRPFAEVRARAALEGVEMWMLPPSQTT